MFEYKRLIATLLAAQLCACGVQPAPAPADDFELVVTEYPYTTDGEGNDLPIEVVRFSVPAIRGARAAQARRIELGYVRYAANDESTAGHATVILTDNAVDSARRRELYLELRRFGDVIVFSHRGFGMSAFPVTCTQNLSYPVNRPLDAALLSTSIRNWSAACLRQLEDAGIPASAVQYGEAAADLHDLASVLNKQRLTLITEQTSAPAALKNLADYPGDYAAIALLNPDVAVRFDSQGGGANGNAPRTADALGELGAAGRDATRALEGKAPELLEVTTPSGRKVDIAVGPLDVAFVAAMTLRQNGVPPASLRRALVAAAAGQFAELGGPALEARQAIAATGTDALLAAANVTPGAGVVTDEPWLYAVQWPASAFGTTASAALRAAASGSSDVPALLIRIGPDIAMPDRADAALRSFFSRLQQRRVPMDTAADGEQPSLPGIVAEFVARHSARP